MKNKNITLVLLAFLFPNLVGCYSSRPIANETQPPRNFDITQNVKAVPISDNRIELHIENAVILKEKTSQKVTVTTQLNSYKDKTFLQEGKTVIQYDAKMHVEEKKEFEEIINDLHDGFYAYKLQITSNQEDGNILGGSKILYFSILDGKWKMGWK